MFKRLVDGFFVAGQLQREDFARAAAEGVRTVINNRPDGEAPDQLSHAEARQAAQAHGLNYHYLPVANGQMTVETVDALRALLADAEQPVLAYCRTGTRSTFLWAFAHGETMASEEIVQAAADAGYDLGGIAPQLQAMRRR